jgi:hypothetical protein
MMMMADYSLYYRVGVQVPRNVTCVHVHRLVTFIHSYGWEGQRGDPYGHLTHCYKGKSLLFNHGDLEGESRLEK